MTDYHVHIGQWNKSYFFAERIFSALKENGVDECWFSSTTSCVTSRTIDAGTNSAVSPAELYGSIRGEVRDALSVASEISIKAHALYWIIPDVVRAGISVEQAMSEVSYEGFKLHPRAQAWDLDSHDCEIAESVFSYAEKHNLRIMIHTGLGDDIDSPRKFEPLIKSHPNCLVQLAHLKDLDAQEYMLKTYPNVVVDSSFAGQEQVSELVRRGVDSSRILWGSDMPVSYVWANRDNVNVSSEPEKDDLIRFYGEHHIPRS